MSNSIYQPLFAAIFNILLLTQANADTMPSNHDSDDNAFTLTAIYFNKVDLINSIEFFSLYEDHLGTIIEISVLERICDDITQHYQTRGYKFARCTLPPQKFKEGVVNMHITEGIVGAVRLTGDIDENDSLLNSYINHISLDKPLEESQLNHVLHMINALPGVNVKAYTRFMPDTQHLELVFDVQQISFNGEVYANNRGSKVIGSQQAGMSLAGYSLLGLHEYLRLHLLTTKESDELKFVEVNSAWPIGNNGSQLIFESTYASSEPGDFLEPENINIDISTASLGWSKPVIITASDTTLFTTSIDYSRLDTAVSDSRTALDELYKIRLSLDHITRNTRRYTRANITLTHGITGLNTTEATSDAQTNDLVSTGMEDFTAVKFDLYYGSVLLNNLLLSSQLQGQYAFRDLPVSENIYFGGEVIGSAYDTAELFGDHGLGGKIRLAHQLEDMIVSSGYTQFYMQYDIARVWNNALDVITSGASLAAGLAVSTGAFYIDLQAAKPLTKQVLLEGNKDTRFFASARLFF